MEEGGWGKCFSFFFFPVSAMGKGNRPLLAVGLDQHLGIGGVM